MKTLFIGKNCIEVQEIDSTNSYLAGLVQGSTHEKKENAVFEGTVVVAKHQVQGRGQRGSSWESEPGRNLTLSILLQPSFLGLEEQFELNKAISLGVLEFVQAVYSPFKGRASIKWPNDIYIGNKKVAGILIENLVNGNKLQQSIVGIGINVNQEKFSSLLPNPTSLKLAAGKEFDLKECLEELCSCIEKRYLELRAGHTAGIDTDYLKNLYRIGEIANYNFKGETIQARISGVLKSGKLILVKDNGERLECDFKEVGFC
jgi:BirA family biotin operon repressor/biotin-[acetyl-CoA-carboxylase] ligase